MKIKYLKNHQINFIRWDNCINTSINGSVFAYSWYLNIICENWDALILGNYEYVMPLLQFENFNKKIIFTSKLSNRLGVFSNKILSEDINKLFFEAIPKKFSSVNILLNKFNKISNKNIKKHKTYELDLMQTYLKLHSRFSTKFILNIKTAIDHKVTIIKGLSYTDFINFTLNRSTVSKPNLNKKEQIKLRRIINWGLKYNLIETYGAYTAENNLCAVGLFIRSKHKMYLLYSSMNKAGLKSNALHLLISDFIKTHSEKNLTLNLENIIVNNDVDFLTGVGAQAYYYSDYYSSILPFFMKFLIKHFSYGKYSC